MIAVFLGAGFSFVGGVPLASQLFDYEPEVDRITRQRLMERVLEDWDRWHNKYQGQPEEYLAFVQEYGGRRWLDAVWYVALIKALKMGRVEYVGQNRTITRHNIDRTSGIGTHEKFWSIIFRHDYNVGVITTNYDILPERGLRHMPRPRVFRPGFNYGSCPTELEGGGYPSYVHIRRIVASGSVPILKLHGSVSWSFRHGKLIYYHACRPAVRGDAAIVAPVTSKTLPKYLDRTWELSGGILSSASKWIIVGYSLPDYDILVRQLLKINSTHGPEVHIFDPNREIAERYKSVLPYVTLRSHTGLPVGLDDLDSVFEMNNA